MSVGYQYIPRDEYAPIPDGTPVATPDAVPPIVRTIAPATACQWCAAGTCECAPGCTACHDDAERGYAL